jgi:farnesyl diphosphate synthase
MFVIVQCRQRGPLGDRIDIEGLAHALHQADDFLGRDAVTDAQAGKATIVGILGPAGARARLRALVGDAEAALAPFKDAAAVLLAAAKFVAEREA